jgi:hypothetical protein
VAAAGSSCAAPGRQSIRPERSLSGRGLVALRFVSSSASNLFRPDGKPCGPAPRAVHDGLFGWEDPEAKDEAGCAMDTFDDPLRPARLEFRFAAVLPHGGNFTLTQGSYGLGAWGQVVSRGIVYGESLARARLTVEAVAPSCRAAWSKDVARALVTGTWARAARFSGWLQVEDLRLVGCRGDEPIEVRVALVGEANRGRIEVDWFGFSALHDDDADWLFGLRPAP